MYTIIGQSGNTATYRTDFLVDTLAEIQNLPKKGSVIPGSAALCLENTSVWVLNNENTWVEIK